MAAPEEVPITVTGERFESGNTASVKSETLATNVGANPWAIFVNNIAALYYF